MGVDLRVREPARRAAALASGLVPVDAAVHHGSGGYIGSLLVRVEGGAGGARGGTLSGLEYARITDEMATVLPQPDRIRLTPR